MVLPELFGIGLADHVETRGTALTPRTCLAHRRFLPLHWLFRTQENAWK